MKQVILDIGNTRIKCAIFEDGQQKDLHYFDASNYNSLISFLKTVDAQQAILSTTQKDNSMLLSFLNENYQTIEFNTDTPLPIDISYETPDTLGDDRKAAVCAVYSQLGYKPFLVITAGTCYTYNFFDGQSFVGGGISPGIHLRYASMHEHTGNLPLVDDRDFNQLVGKTTEESILSGVRQGIISEVEGICLKYQLLHADLRVFICGGDTDFLVSNVKYDIFASQNLVIDGLYQILDFNLNT